MAAMVESRKRKAYTIVEKLHIVDRIKSGETHTKIIKKTGVAGSTLLGWLKDEGKLRAASSTMDDGGQIRKRARHAKDHNLETAVLT
jgi:hypothetical protein